MFGGNNQPIFRTSVMQIAGGIQLGIFDVPPVPYYFLSGLCCWLHKLIDQRLERFVGYANLCAGFCGCFSPPNFPVFFLGATRISKNVYPLASQVLNIARIYLVYNEKQNYKGICQVKFSYFLVCLRFKIPSELFKLFQLILVSWNFSESL